MSKRALPESSEEAVVDWFCLPLELWREVLSQSALEDFFWPISRRWHRLISLVLEKERINNLFIEWLENCEEVATGEEEPLPSRFYILPYRGPIGSLISRVVKSGCPLTVVLSLYRYVERSTALTTEKILALYREARRIGSLCLLDAHRNSQRIYEDRWRLCSLYIIISLPTETNDILLPFASYSHLLDRKGACLASTSMDERVKICGFTLSRHVICLDDASRNVWRTVVLCETEWRPHKLKEKQFQVFYTPCEDPLRVLKYLNGRGSAAFSLHKAVLGAVEIILTHYASDPIDM